MQRVIHHLKKNQKEMKKITKDRVILKILQKLEKENVKTLMGKRKKK
jgi:myo-inositol-1-phosphate synthase